METQQKRIALTQNNVLSVYQSKYFPSVIFAPTILKLLLHKLSFKLSKQKIIQKNFVKTGFVIN
jgi:hypothetical protein